MMDTDNSNNLDAKLAESRRNALRAVDLLVDNHVPPLPVPYAVAYEYWAGVLSDLHKALDKHLGSGKTLDEYFLREIYETYLATDRFSRVHGLRDNLQNILRTLMETMAEAGESNAEFRQAVEENVRQLAGLPADAAIRAIAENLLKAAAKVEASSRGMHDKLEQARRETEQLRVELEQQRQESLIDPLTGLYNRRAMEQFGGELMESADTAQVTLLVLDIDLFKSINDSYGHAVGDVVIRQVADTLRKCIRGDDIAVRFGGEEFVVMLPKTSLEGAMVVAEAIRHRVESLRLVRRSDNLAVRPFTISIGVAGRRPDDTWDTLFQRADQALYQAKHNGRNCVVRES